MLFLALSVPVAWPRLGQLTALCVNCRDDTSGEDAEDKEPTVAVKGRRTANSQGRRKGRITRSMTSEVEEAAAPPVNNELGSSRYKNSPFF